MIANRGNSPSESALSDVRRSRNVPNQNNSNSLEFDLELISIEDTQLRLKRT
jgi:hypothetical protein